MPPIDGLLNRVLAISTFTIQYAAAPVSFARRYRGNVCLYWSVFDFDGFIVLPVPRWFKRYKWKRFVPIEGQYTSSDNGSRGLKYTKYKVEHRNYHDYLEAVVIDRVSEYLRTKGLQDFNLRSSK